MLFNSLEFLLFMAVFFAAWPMLRRSRNGRWGYLVVASFFFYGWWDWRFLFLIMFSGFIDYFAALGMARWQRRRKAFLVASIIGNIGSLAAFKYLDFAVHNANWLLRLFGISQQVPLAGLILPVGISFYTFQSMSYTIDVYRGRLEPTRNVLHFFAYLAMFPQLVAGPIIRAAHLLPQLKEVHRPTPEQRWDGLKLIVCGFFKKVVIADTIAPVVNQAFANSQVTPSCAYWWLVMVMFAYQIYCDSSGYSDIARGLGRWMGYDFPVNFDHPYIAGSIREFWSRWHISLSTWFRDYVYIPLGGSRRGAGRAHLFMWMTMLLSGLWHGAAWAFLVWAALHALYLSAERLTQWPKRLCRLPLGRHAAVLIVFALTLVAWVFFRVGSLRQLGANEQLARAGQILAAMFDFGNFRFDLVRQLLDSWPLELTGLMILRQLWFHFRLEQRSLLPAPAGAKLQRWLGPVVLAAGIAACVYLRGPGSAFIYFQF